MKLSVFYNTPANKKILLIRPELRVFDAN